MAAAVASLRAALEGERSSLQQIDASIKRIVQSHNDRQYNTDRFNSGDGGRFNHSGEGGRGLGGSGGGAGAGRFAPRGTDLPTEAGKRKLETKTVFSRLRARPDGDGDSDHEEGAAGKRPRILSQVTRDLPSKKEIMKAQCGDEQSKVRNRRMFGSLLGTLQKFRQEEIVLKSKEDKRAQVERRIEEQAVQERENQRRERQTLFADREIKKATIKALEAKLARVTEFDAWAARQSTLGNFILTRARPHIFWLPRKPHRVSDERLAASRQHHENYMEKKRQELEEELIRIEQKCLRSAKGGQGAAHFTASKENKMADRQNGEAESNEEAPSRNKREKFVSEVRGKEKNGTVVKMEEDEEEQRERRGSKDRPDEIRHRKRSHLSESAVRESELVVTKQERNSKGERGAEEESESKQDDEITAERNGSHPATPTPDESHEEAGDSNVDGGADARRPSDGSPSGDPARASSPAPGDSGD